MALLSAAYVIAAREQLDRMDPERGDKRGWSSFWTQRAHVAHLAPPWLSHRKNSRVANARHSVDDTRFAPSVGSAHRDHRYWMGSVLYGLGRYDGARPYVESLAREFPARLRLKGLAALVAARRHDFVAAERWLEPAAPINLAEHMVRCARIVVIQGKRRGSDHRLHQRRRSRDHQPSMAHGARVP